MSFEEWLELKKAREAIERSLIDLARQIASLPEGHPARKALQDVFDALYGAWQAADGKLNPPQSTGPTIGPMPPPKGGITPEERERIRRANDELQHAMWEFFNREMRVID